MSKVKVAITTPIANKKSSKLAKEQEALDHYLRGNMSIWALYKFER